jgi:glycosyltransferase involved in cell wall biosynthesis
MRIPPCENGHGGSQRAWYLVNAMAKLDKVHFVLLYRNTDKDMEGISLEPLKSVTESITLIAVDGWTTTKALWRWVPWRIGIWIDILRYHADEAPQLSIHALRDISSKLPIKHTDYLFACRLPCSTIADDLIRHDLLVTKKKILDVDDLMSTFMERQIVSENMSIAQRLRRRVELFFVKRAERKILNSWDSISASNISDADLLRKNSHHANIFHAPNVINRSALSKAEQRQQTVLFVGNLSFPPNVHGLKEFVSTAWPLIKQKHPDAKLKVVGLRPSQSLFDELLQKQIEVFANVVSVEPFYAECNIVICPILFGSGTRIKILEAMAYGRPVVSTTIGAEGLGVISGEHALLADKMDDFASKVNELLGNPTLADTLAKNARMLQETVYHPDALYRQIKNMTV